jgi:hypothetical protein
MVKTPNKQRAIFDSYHISAINQEVGRAMATRRGIINSIGIAFLSCSTSAATNRRKPKAHGGWVGCVVGDHVSLSFRFAHFCARASSDPNIFCLNVPGHRKSQ